MPMNIGIPKCLKIIWRQTFSLSQPPRPLSQYRILIHRVTLSEVEALTIHVVQSGLCTQVSELSQRFFIRANHHPFLLSCRPDNYRDQHPLINAPAL